MNSCHRVVTEFFEGKQFLWFTKYIHFLFRSDNDLHGFFYKQPSCYGSNVKNGLKVKQLAKQPPTLKVRMQKILVQLNSE